MGGNPTKETLVGLRTGHRTARAVWWSTRSYIRSTGGRKLERKSEWKNWLRGMAVYG